MKGILFAAPRFELTTPEHVKLRFEVAPLATRAMAVLLDCLFMLLAIVALVLVFSVIAAVAGSGEIGGWIAAVAIIGAFALRNGYFIHFELKDSGVTPGKRRLGIQVIARDGGALTAEMVAARNFLREVELFLPLTLLLVLPAGQMDLPPALVACTAVWAGLVVAFPCCNRLGLRFGDLAAGTVVVLSPRPELLPDLLARQGAAEPLSFSRKELALFGVEHVKAAEAILREPPGERRDELCRKVAKKIAAKLDRGESPAEMAPDAFLEAFYRALRAELERTMLVGKPPPSPGASHDGGGRRRAAP